MSDDYAAVVAERLGHDGVSTLIAHDDSNGGIRLVRPDAHLGWRGRADPDDLDRWPTAVTRHGRAG
jgi:4,5-epoxidase